MNFYISKGKVYKLINFWKDNKHIIDSNGIPYSEPLENKTEWKDKENFIVKLKNVELDLIDKSVNYKKSKKCMLCDEKDIITKYFYLNGYIWQDGLFHYINKHNIKPVDEFIEKINDYKIKIKKNILRFEGTPYLINNLKYVKLDKNQLHILDALMKHGGYKKKYADNKNNKIFRYSEHAGLLDFNNNGIEKIIISGETMRVDKYDNEIYMPTRIPDILNYEYMFHTHPPTPKPGGRANVGVLYEFPSISDIFHFISHYNRGKTQGSIVITPEGLYNIRALKPNIKKIKINEELLLRKLKKVMRDTQDFSLKKYGPNFTTNYFYSVIAQDTSFIEKINDVLREFDIFIDFFPREKDLSNRWIINTIYLPVYIIENS